MYNSEIKNLSISEKKLVKSLHQRKYRYLNKRYLVEGEKMIKDLIKYYPENIELLIFSDELSAANSELKADYAIRYLAAEEYKNYSTLVTPQGVMAVVKMPETVETLDSGWIIFLDALQDPGNAGTIIRTADWFGIKNIVFSKGSVDPYSPKVVQASMGSIFNSNISESSIENLKELLPNTSFFAADLDGTNIFKTDFPEKGVLCIGNEGNGLSKNVRQVCDQLIFIPGDANRSAESLNAGIATAIILSKLASS